TAAVTAAATVNVGVTAALTAVATWMAEMTTAAPTGVATPSNATKDLPAMTPASQSEGGAESIGVGMQVVIGLLSAGLFLIGIMVLRNQAKPKAVTPAQGQVDRAVELATPSPANTGQDQKVFEATLAILMNPPTSKDII
ncbi:hypothetical protein EBZ35_05745, partial [bacterium]|nr:hypothetical protein [bacterium]